MKQMDLTARSDKLLLAMGFELSGVATNMFMAVIVWQRLVELEAQLANEEKLEKALSTELTQARAQQLKADCNEVACELKALYNAIAETLPSIPPALDVVIAKLEKDYLEVFKAEGL